ncbi:hypothetical protein TcasGA2_TC031133 [Tribolium castaneum]|uniref:Protein takeout-like Protein n=2 Tax=Tribolium castaneum TaxID=7070 RepID=A0A139WHM8_TRICA|nr:hypothetical protein TcasGA2_TC031133 [Tribolium castaneum]
MKRFAILAVCVLFGLAAAESEGIGNASVANFELTGLQGFQVPYLHLAVVGMQLNFTFVLPSINLFTDYKGDLLVANLVPFYGAGKANVHILNAEIQGSAQTDLSNGISLKNLRIQLYVESATFDIHGALNNEDFSQILSALLNDLVPSFIDNHQQVISDILSPIIEGLINAILNGGGSSTPGPTTTP